MHKYLDIVNKYAQVKALVVGDAIIDIYHFGRVDRISPEAPVPIYIEDSEKCETRRGGADNVAHQLEVLGCQVETVFAVKRSVKHRYFSGHHLVFRRDSDQVGTAEKSISVLGFDVVVLSDYAKGVLSTDVCKNIIQDARQHNMPVVVDPKGTDWNKYSGATVICPNQQEMQLISELRSIEADFGAVLLKRGEHGLQIRERSGFTDIPTVTHQVHDVTGAGDTVTALIAASIGAKASLQDAAVIANHAAGVVVGKLGTAVCTKDELLRSLCE